MTTKDLELLTEAYKGISDGNSIVLDEDDEDSSLEFASRIKETLSQDEFDRVYDSQYRLIKNYFGKDEAERANYGWYADENVSTSKIYGNENTILTSGIDKDTNQVIHILPGGKRENINYKNLKPETKQDFGQALEEL